MSVNLMEKLELEAKKNPKKVAFPESNNEMILKAAQEVVLRKIGEPIIIGNQEIVETFAKSLDVDTTGFVYVDNTDEDVRRSMAFEYISKFNELSEKAIIRKTKDPLNLAMVLVKLGVADCVAAGREYTTADVIISAQSIIGLSEGCQTISSLGILDVPNYDGPEGNMLAIADCAVIPQPDSNELADIAISSADTVKRLMKWEPRVGMLGFSTCGSAEHESIDVIIEAIKIVKKRRPDLKIDGEFQLDAAINPAVAEKKVKRPSEVAGKANILIFPNLHAGNIGVKLIQTFGRANAYGPVLQGFSLPVCDFSRSAPLPEMMGNIIMLIIRANGEE